MARLTTLPYSPFAFALLGLVLLFTSCNQHAHHTGNCSSALPAQNFTDTLRLVTADSNALQDGNTGMCLIPAGGFVMGAIPNDTFARPDELPAHRVTVDSFWIDATEVTNAQFRAFVKATGYVTTAERAVPKGSLVFSAENKPEGELYWWKFVEGADWQHPLGPNSNIDTMDNYPVVQVSWFDAMAYASWAGKRLPTEAEWEYAARAGKAGALYPWGNQSPEETSLANVFQGTFPNRNTAADGFALTAPVQYYAANEYGLYNISGNVWEWCADKFHANYYAYCTENNLTANPQGPVRM